MASGYEWREGVYACYTASEDRIPHLSIDDETTLCGYRVTGSTISNPDRMCGACKLRWQKLHAEMYPPVQSDPLTFYDLLLAGLKGK